MNSYDWALAERVYRDKYLLFLGINAYLMGDYFCYCSALAKRFDFTQDQLFTSYNEIKYIVLHN